MSEVRANTAQYTFKVAGETFQVLRFTADEEISELSRFELELRSDDPEVDIKSLLRQDAEIRLAWGETAPQEKTWYGIVRSFSQTAAGVPGEEEGEYGRYTCELVPTLWLLSQKRNCKIFQEMSTDEILKAVLDERGMAGKYELKLTKSYPKREYCVQYRESDFAFLSRLMEEEGIFYWFRHEDEEKMILGDSPDAYGKCWPEDAVEYRRGTGELAPAQEVLTQLTYEETTYSGKVRYKDSDYRQPKAPLRVEEKAADHDDLEIYDYHRERYRDDSRGRALAKTAVEAQAAHAKTLAGSGTWRSLTTGSVLKLDKAYRLDLNGDWVVVEAAHEVSQGASSGLDYAVSFTAIPAKTPFRPLPDTPPPSLTMQTATVVGPANEEIYMDKYGRAKVQFHWDPDGRNDESSSCWIRVAQPYAGIQEDTQKKHGFQWHPLVGDEVVVDFLEGDPDRPLIVGSVYNADHMQPIKPEELIRNLIRTRYQHELLFDDKGQAITLTTPYPHRLHLDDPTKKASLTTKYGHSIELWDPHKDNENVGSITLKTGGDETFKLEDKHPKYGNNFKLASKDGHSIHFAEGSAAKGIKATTKEGHTLSLDDKEKQILLKTTGGHQVLLDDKNKKIEVTSSSKHRIVIDDQGNAIEIADSSGQHHFKIDTAGGKLTVGTATGSIDIQAPAGTVKIDALNVEINAKAKLQLKGTEVATEGTAKVSTQGAMVSSTASATNTIQGAMVKLN